MRIEVDRVENPRFASNVSGTLALELWALPFEYAGGAFQGFPLSGGAFDGFGGNRFVAEASFDLPFVAPPPGSWQLVLMLREWTPLGFVTRDFRNFATPFQVESPAPAAPPEAEAGPVAPVAPARIAKPAVKAAPAVAAAPEGRCRPGGRHRPRPRGRQTHFESEKKVPKVQKRLPPGKPLRSTRRRWTNWPE
ncbi:MAG: hypothetical protein WDN28_16910 [Chthoniobacter sp.]